MGSARQARSLRADLAWSLSWQTEPRQHQVKLPSNNAVNLTSSGAFLLPLGNRGGGARVEGVEPLDAGYGER